MSVLCVGITYRRASLELLERLSIDDADLPKALAAVRSSSEVREAAILSTCNRVEVYADVRGYHAGIAELRRFLEEFRHPAPEELAARADIRYEEEAARHLFGVAAGIDSMVVGEPQILQQVRRAFAVAQAEGAVGPTLSALFRGAIRVGRRARAETAIARSAGTFARAGIDLARDALGSLDGRAVLVVGAGEMSDLAAAAAACEGARVLVANRTPSRALRLAQRVAGEVVAFGSVSEALARADVVITSTGSRMPLISAETVARAGRPLVMIDLGVPRDVDPAAAEVPDVLLYDLDDLRAVVAPDDAQLAEIERVRGIVGEEVPRLVAWQRARHLGPLLRALQARGERVRSAEIRRASAALAGLDAAQREAVERLTRSLVGKILNDPIAAVKRYAGTPEGDALARALRALYRLGEER